MYPFPFSNKDLKTVTNIGEFILDTLIILDQLYDCKMLLITGSPFLLDFKVTIIGMPLTFRWTLKSLPYFVASIGLLVHSICTLWTLGFSSLWIYGRIFSFQKFLRELRYKRLRKTIVTEVKADLTGNFCPLCRGCMSRAMAPPTVYTELSTSSE